MIVRITFSTHEGGFGINIAETMSVDMIMEEVREILLDDRAEDAAGGGKGESE